MGSCWNLGSCRIRMMSGLGFGTVVTYQEAMDSVSPPRIMVVSTVKTQNDFSPSKSTTTGVPSRFPRENGQILGEERSNFPEGTVLDGKKCLQGINGKLLHVKSILLGLSSNVAKHTGAFSAQLRLRDQLSEEKLDVTMTFLLEDALCKSAAGLSTRSEFLKYILENKIPEVHYRHVDEDVGSSKASMTHAGIRPRLVDGAREDYIIPGYQLKSEGWGSHNVVLKILEEQGSEGDVPLGGEKYFGERDVELIGGIFHSKSLEYLKKNGPFLMENLEDVKKNCSMLLNIADNLEILPPANDPLPWDILKMSRWKDSLCELIKEMKTVEEKCPSLIHNPRVYVLTTAPYGAFLRALAAETADATAKM